MPIIPRYNLSQTSTHLHIEVSIPHVRVSTSTLDLVIVDGTELHLYAPPTYLLKLTLPDRVLGEDAVEESLSLACSGGSAATDTAGSSSDVVRLVEEVDVNSNGGDVDVDGDGDCTSANAEPTAAATEEAHIPIIWTKEDLPKLQYDPEKNHGTLVVILRKEQEAFWNDLDLLGRLQQPTQRQREKQLGVAARQGQGDDDNKRMAKPKSLVEEVDVEDEDGKGKGGEIETDESNFDFDTPQVMADLLSVNKKTPTYGLFQRFSNVFRDYAREGLAHEMLECPNPDDELHEGSDDDEDGASELRQNRREMRSEMENGKFDSDRYLNDLYVEEEGDMVFDSAMTMVPHWMGTTNVSKKSDESIDVISDRLSKLSTSNCKSNDETIQQCSTAFFTSEESHLLATLPSQNNNTDFRLTEEQKRSALLTLVDILFAYSYDHRTTDGDPTVESSWTVMILSPSLAWLENYNPPYDTISDVVRWSIRRSLVYTYLRSYTLARKVVEDVCQILNGGRRVIIRCLLQLHRIMEKSESHYLFNKLYVDPLIGWMQLCEEAEVQAFGKEMEITLMKTGVDGSKDSATDVLAKQNLGLGLVELEKSFFECYDDEESTSSDEEDDDDDESSANYDSDSDSRGVDEETAGTTETDEEELKASDQNKKTIATLEGQSKNGTDSDRSKALLDENIGHGNSTPGIGKDS